MLDATVINRQYGNENPEDILLSEDIDRDYIIEMINMQMGYTAKQRANGKLTERDIAYFDDLKLKIRTLSSEFLLETCNTPTDFNEGLGISRRMIPKGNSFHDEHKVISSSSY